MASLNYSRIVLGGTAISGSAASAGGDVVPVADTGFLHVNNASASSVTVTLNTPGFTRFGISEPDVTITVPAGASRLIGPMRADLFDSTVGGVNVTYSAVASVTVTALLV